jgi:hypothetical protein
LLKSRFITSPGIAKFRVGLLTIPVLAVFAIAAPTALAVEVSTLYTAQVPLDEEQDDSQALAYEMALAQVLLRVSGSELSADPDLVALMFPDPPSYVVQFRPGEDNTLWVSFDGEAIERTLRQAGQTVWDSDRPLTLVWLAVDWGQGEREIISATDPERSRDEARSIDRNRQLRQRVLDIAERRGLPIVFPLLDTEDLVNLSFSDLWGGFSEQILLASGRYDIDSILVGRIQPDSNQRNRWSYFFGGDERSWNGEPELVVNLVADFLVDEFAVSGSAPLEFVNLSIAGIHSVEAYGAVENMLSNTSLIEGFTINKVAGDQVHYRLEARGGVERLRRALRFNGLIEQNGSDDDRFTMDSFESSLEFFYSP